MENSHECLNVTYWKDILNFCSGRNIKTLDFDFLLTLICTSSLNRHVEHTCSLMLMVGNINFRIGEESEISDVFHIFQFKEITLFHDFISDLNPYIYIYIVCTIILRE